MMDNIKAILLLGLVNVILCIIFVLPIILFGKGM